MATESGETSGEEPALPHDDEMAATDKPRHKGRLELTWTNKGEALLSRDDGSYEWVPKRDHRVAEVRLLRDAGIVGEVHPEADRARDNLLIRGDAVHALTALNSLPEFASEYAGKIKLVYIDPPFNTGQAFAQYDDGLEHSVWLTMMRDRLEQIKDLLAPNGSVWVHLDDAEQAYCKVMMDDIFGRENFVSTIVWEKRHSRSSDAIVSHNHDYILIYANDVQTWKKVRNNQERGEKQDKDYKNPNDDPRGRWITTQMLSPSYRASGDYTITAPNGTEHECPRPTSWRYPRATFDKLLAEDKVYWGKSGNGQPRIKRFLSEMEGVVPKSWWPNDETGHGDEAKREVQKLFPGIDAFATPKPERLMQRIIHIASNPGEVVLDCFGGSGTTAAVAHKMGRRWVTCELSRETLDTFTAPRLQKVVAGEDSGGITKAADWQGGGGFRVLDVAPSMYEDDAGIVVLADWAENSKLAELIAAQLGFTFEPDPPFHGKHGRMRLAVVDGHADQAVVRLLVRALPEGQRLSLAATSLDPEAATLLTKLKSGSQARVVPQDILLSYRTPASWRATVAKPAPEAPDSAEDSAGADASTEAGATV